ncbi:hypothetical protein COCNU_02G018340 [Cocos nucifera]|uniref:Uncharacterized protein n=1 Tax=Cocos nucifera TaxID=13894 RepID=A0A8K0MXN4_COCNU|nr:hypothetical protein COCNU_02G018340 [Cocos nucifera]
MPEALHGRRGRMGRTQLPSRGNPSYPGGSSLKTSGTWDADGMHKGTAPFMRSNLVLNMVLLRLAMAHRAHRNIPELLGIPKS